MSFFNKKSNYFVSYTYLAGKASGSGNSHLIIKGTVSSDTIIEMQETIKKENGFDKVVILNFIKL
jgi:hypothetical protein